MNKLSYHLILVNSSLRVLNDQIDQLCDCIERQIEGTPHPALQGNGQNIKVINKPQLNKQSAFDETSSGNQKFYEKIQNEKKSIMDLVYESIKRSRKGIVFVKIQEKTGLNRKQIANAIYKLKCRNIIETKSRGIYIRKVGS